MAHPCVVRNFDFSKRKPGNRPGRKKYQGPRTQNSKVEDADRSKQDPYLNLLLSTPRHAQDPEALQERQLVAAVLLRAIIDAYGIVCLATQNARREARLWFKHPSDEPFSFIWVCEILTLNSHELLKTIEGLDFTKVGYFSQTLYNLIERRQASLEEYTLHYRRDSR